MSTHARGRGAATAAVAAILVPALLLRAGWGEEQAIDRISRPVVGGEANGASLSSAVSADGRYVVFASDASNLVAPDANSRDIFVRDRLTSTTDLVSRAGDGSQANAASLFPAISGDGRYAVFQSAADNLVPDDDNETSDIFVRDRLTATSILVSRAPDGSPGNNDSVTPSISADGRYVTFTSRASDLVPDDLNDDLDVFVRDLETGSTELISIASDGTRGDFASGGLGAGPARVSADGRYVVFGSFATNLVPDDHNALDDAYLRDRVLGITERLSVGSSGAEGNGHSLYPSISDDGRYAVFHSAADNLTPVDANHETDVFLRDRASGSTIRLSDAPGSIQGNGSSRFAVISADGRFVAFHSDATNLASEDVEGQTDIFLYEIDTGHFKRVSMDPDGNGGNGPSTFPSLSSDGTVLAFQSNATDLVFEDTNGATDIFAWGKLLAPPAPTATGTPPPSKPSGDVNCDGDTNSIDAALVLQLSAGLTGSLACQQDADVSRDDAVNAIDAALILQFGAGLIDTLPP